VSYTYEYGEYGMKKKKGMRFLFRYQDILYLRISLLLLLLLLY